MTNKSYFEIWKVPTLLPVKDSEILAVRFWAHALVERSGLTTHQFVNNYFRNAETNALIESFDKWKKYGSPNPQFLAKDGTPKALFRMELEFPDSLRTLLNPGWIMMSGPTTLRSCQELMTRFEPDVSLTLSRRSMHIRMYKTSKNQKASKLNHPPHPGQSTTSPGYNYASEYFELFQLLGTIEAFFGAMSLHIETMLSFENPRFREGYHFHFNPKKWAFCNSLDDDLISLLKQRCEDLATAYKTAKKTEKNVVPDLPDLVTNFSTHFKLNPQSNTDLDMNEFLKQALKF